MSIKQNNVEGDLSVGRDIVTGGGLLSRGDSTFKKNVRVDGILYARNIRGAILGLFGSIESVNTHYPQAREGSVALIGPTLPAPIYRKENGQWVATGEEGGELKVELTDYLSKEDAETEYAKQTELEDHRDDEEVHLQSLESTGYVWGVVDAEGRQLLGVTAQGDVEFGAGVPSQIRQKLRMVVAPVQRELAQVSKQVADNKDGLSGLTKIVGTGTAAYVWGVVDAKGRQLLGVTAQGDVEFGAGVPSQIRQKLRMVVAPVQRELAQVWNEVNAIKEVFATGEEENLFMMLDAANKPIFTIGKDGVMRPAGLELPADAQSKIAKRLTDMGIDLSSHEHIELPMPASLCRIDLLCPFSLNDSYLGSNALRCRARFTGMGYAFEKPIDLEWQGSSSRNFPRKNLAITWLNEDGEDCDIRFGQMIATSDYHLKANFIDATQSRNVCSCRLYEQMQQTRSYPRRPWQEVVATDATDARLLFDNGAMGHIDGFPVEVYHNGEYWGLFTMNLKKDRKNFRMDKKTQYEIILELGGGINSNNTWDNFSWADYEIRNPKVNNADGREYKEGDVPEESEMKYSVEDWFTWLKLVSDDDFKEQAQERMFIPQMIDYMLLMTVLYNADSWTRNGLLCSWDGYKFGLLPYDMDCVCGMNGYGLKSDNATNVWLQSVWENGTATLGSDLVYGRIYRHFKEEFFARYGELRNKGIFTVENITELFADFGRQIGTDAYERWFEAYRYDDGTCMIPSHRPEGSVIPDEYKNNFNQDGGWYTSVRQINEWLKVRIETLDGLFGYNNQ